MLSQKIISIQGCEVKLLSPINHITICRHKLTHMLSTIITAFLVSTDAFFVGLSLGSRKSFDKKLLLVIAGIIFVTALIAYFVICSIKSRIAFDTSLIVGTAFLLLGFRNLFSKDEEKARVMTLGGIILLGLIMSIDGVVATAVLTIEQAHSVLIPTVVAFGHLVLLVAGSFFVGCIRASHRVHNFMSASCLMLVGILRLSGVL